MDDLSRNAQVLKFFAQQYGRPGVPRKRLIKLAYMADVLARQYLGHPVTTFSYIKDHFGPNDRALPDFVDELERAGFSEEYIELDPPRRTYRLRDTGKPIIFDFSPGENEVLGYVAQNYLNMDLEEFIEEVVKETDPFKAVSREGEKLPMSLVDNAMRREIGFDLEAVIRAEQQAEAGEYSTLTGFADELRAEIAARHPE